MKINHTISRRNSFPLCVLYSLSWILKIRSNYLRSLKAFITQDRQTLKGFSKRVTTAIGEKGEPFLVILAQISQVHLDLTGTGTVTVI